MTDVGLKPTIGHRRRALSSLSKGFVPFLVFWWPVWFIAITAGEMWIDHGVIAAVVLVVVEIVTFFLLALVS
jgi:hypothetical protein